MNGPRSPRRRILRALLALGIVGALIVGGAAGYVSWGSGGTAEGAPVTVEVPPGASASQIADLLADAEVIRSSLAFRIVVRLRSLGAQLKPGTYELREGLGVDGAIEVLTEGIARPTETFTIPEGETVAEIIGHVARQTHLSSGAIERALTSGKHRLDIMPARVDELEGLLFPKTYEIFADSGANDVVRVMLDQFEAEVASLDLTKADRLGLTPYEVVIVASLIEREAREDADRPKIASVIYNRIERGMRLQIDATVQYAILRQTGSYKENLTQDDYTAVRSDWNTYLIDGLPPTPIASPGLASLRAALNPAETDFLFYRLYQGSTRHCFSRDSAGHAACGDRTEP